MKTKKLRLKETLLIHLLRELAPSQRTVHRLILFHTAGNSKILTETTHEKSAQAYEKLVGLLPDAIEELQKMGPDSTDEFISVVKALSKGYLTENISFHLMLDIGRFYETSSVASMRYNDETMSFWVTIEKLFKGRGINF